MRRTEVIEPEFSQTNGAVDAFFTLRNDQLFAKNGLAAALRDHQKAARSTVSPPESDEIISRREQLFKQLGLKSSQVAWAHQVHGNEVKKVSKHGLHTNVDALISTQPGLSLIIQVADCAAVLIYDPNNKITAAVHAGWRGAASNIVGNTLNKMKHMGAEPKEILAYISPCISQTHFEVGEEVAEQFSDRFVDRASFKKPHINLKACIAYQLKSAGVQAKNIEINSQCTVSNSQWLYSYRREKEQSGRMLAVITLQDNQANGYAS